MKNQRKIQEMMEKNKVEAMRTKQDYSTFLSKQIQTKEFVDKLINEEKKRQGEYMLNKAKIIEEQTQM